MDLKAEARRMAEDVLCGDWENTTKRIESALLAFGRLVREEDAKVCDEQMAPIIDPCGNVKGIVPMNARQCAAAIRKKLKSLE